jgi:hypothetical protein
LEDILCEVLLKWYNVTRVNVHAVNLDARDSDEEVVTAVAAETGEANAVQDANTEEADDANKLHPLPNQHWMPYEFLAICSWGAPSADNEEESWKCSVGESKSHVSTGSSSKKRKPFEGEEGYAMKSPRTPGGGTFSRSSQRKDSTRRAIALQFSQNSRRNNERKRRRDRGEDDVSEDEETNAYAASETDAAKASIVRTGEALSSTLQSIHASQKLSDSIRAAEKLMAMFPDNEVYKKKYEDLLVEQLG